MYLHPLADLQLRKRRLDVCRSLKAGLREQVLLSLLGVETVNLSFEWEWAHLPPTMQKSYCGLNERIRGEPGYWKLEKSGGPSSSTATAAMRQASKDAIKR